MTQEVKVGAQRDVHDYLQTVPGQARSIETVTAATGIEYIKVGQALAYLARNPALGIRRISKGVYRLELDRVDEGLPLATRGNRPPPMVHDWAAVKPTITPETLVVLGRDKHRLLLVQLPDGTVGRVEPL